MAEAFLPQRVQPPDGETMADGCLRTAVCHRAGVGDYSGRGTPGHIPNPEVKPASADGTTGASPWESRALPTPVFPCLFPPPSVILQSSCTVHKYTKDKDKQRLCRCLSLYRNRRDGLVWTIETWISLSLLSQARALTSCSQKLRSKGLEGRSSLCIMGVTLGREE